MSQDGQCIEGYGKTCSEEVGLADVKEMIYSSQFG